MAPDSNRLDGDEETIVTPFGEMIVVTDIPQPPRETPIFIVTGSEFIENEPTTEIQESGPWRGFPTCFNATEKWSIETIRNHTDNAHIVNREYTTFATDSSCNITYVSAMGVDLGINRTPGREEYGSALIVNNIWKGIPRVRTERHSLNMTGSIDILPVRTLLRDLTPDMTIGGIDQSMFPVVIDQIELGYFHRSRQGRCGDIELWEPAWILSGTAVNGTPVSFWIWAADQKDIRILLNPPQSLPGVPEIITYTQEGVQVQDPLSGTILPFPDTRLVSEFEQIQPETRDSFWVHPLDTYPSFPSTIMVYRDVTSVNEDTVRDIANHLGMNGKLESLSGSFRVRDEDRELSVDPGFTHYQVLNRPNGVQDEINLTPTEEEALARAIGFLTASELFEPETLPETFIGTEGRFSNESVVIRYQTMTVFFRRTINGFPVFKNSIRVEVGGNGDIVEVTKRWGDYLPVREYPLIGPEEAYQHLLKSDMVDGYEMALGSMYMRKKFEKCGNEEIGPLLVNITGVSLEYYGRDTLESGLLRPAYTFEYEFVLAGEHLPASFSVPAIPELGVFEDWNYQAPV